MPEVHFAVHMEGYFFVLLPSTLASDQKQNIKITLVRNCDIDVRYFYYVICPTSVKTTSIVFHWAKSPSEQVNMYPEGKWHVLRQKS